MGVSPGSWIDTEPCFTGLYAPVLETREGKVQIPDGPGWGVEIAETWLAGAAYMASEVE